MSRKKLSIGGFVWAEILSKKWAVYAGARRDCYATEQEAVGAAIASAERCVRVENRVSGETIYLREYPEEE